MGLFGFFLKDRNIIPKVKIYHPVLVRDMDSKTPIIESVPIVNGKCSPIIYPVFLRKGNKLGIGLLFDTQPIFIPPYRMALLDFKGLK